MENGEDSDICHKNLSKNLKKKTLIYFHCSFLLDFPEEHLPGFSQRILNIETLSKNSMFSFSFFILRRPKSVIPFVGGNNVIIISQSQMSCGIGQRKKTWKTHHHNKFRRKKNGNKNSYKLHDDSNSYRGVHLRTLYHLPSNKLQHSSYVLDASVSNSNQVVIFFSKNSR